VRDAVKISPRLLRRADGSRSRNRRRDRTRDMSRRQETACDALAAAQNQRHVVVINDNYLLVTLGRTRNRYRSRARGRTGAGSTV
jgi:hypothetical protein